MESIDDVDPDAVLAGDGAWIGPDVAATLADHPLECVETEYPHVAGAVESADETVRPAEDHPVFYGCFDWHSAVHSHWSLVRGLRLVEDHPEESRIEAGFRDRITEDNVEREVEYVEANPTFEKPYGWAWFLRLAAELHLWDDDRAGEWRTLLKPLETTVVELVEAEFIPPDRPFRVGTHHNTAFALQCVLDYARVVDEESLEAATVETARDLYLDDRDAPVEYEPFGWDFLSPSLAEADLLRRGLDDEAFASWIDGFLPDPTVAPYDSILDPVAVEADPEEGVALHFVGLNLSKAWCMAGLADTLDGHPYAEPLERGARRHVEESLETAFTGEYAGSHWLSTFVLYLATRNAGGIAPG